MLIKEDGYGKCDSLVVIGLSLIVSMNQTNKMETQMQTEIEILETRETPAILWGVHKN